MNNNIQQIELETEVIEQSASGNKILEQEQINRNIQNHEYRIQNLEAQVINVTKTLQSRPQLQEITRIRMLSPTATRLYNINVQLKRQNRFLKRLMKHRKSQEKRQKRTVFFQNNIASTSSTATTQERFIQMMLRNKDIPPQV